MARKKKEELKKTDFITKSLENISSYVRDNTRTCIIGASSVVLVALAISAYVVYEARRNDNIQYILSQALNTFKDYSTTESDETLAKAKDLFGRVAKENMKETGRIAELYLAKIASLQGKNGDAEKTYQRIAKESSNSLIKSLAEAPLQQSPGEKGAKSTTP